MESCFIDLSYFKVCIPAKFQSIFRWFEIVARFIETSRQFKNFQCILIVENIEIYTKYVRIFEMWRPTLSTIPSLRRRLWVLVFYNPTLLILI